MNPPCTLYTVGHSNHTAEGLLALLSGQDIGCVVDVRSRPYSRWKQFGRERLAESLQAAGVAYVWMGDALAGRPDDPALLGADGAPDYDAMARAPAFRRGLEELVAMLAGSARVAVLCSEGDPAHCHREHLIGHAVRARGVRVVHLLRDGGTSEDVAPTAGQQLTFDV